MEVEFEFISNLPAGHSANASFLHFCFNSLDVWYVVRLDLLVDHASIRQLHPERLELFTI